MLKTDKRNYESNLTKENITASWLTCSKYNYAEQDCTLSGNLTNEHLNESHFVFSNFMTKHSTSTTTTATAV